MSLPHTNGAKVYSIKLCSKGETIGFADKLGDFVRVMAIGLLFCAPSFSVGNAVAADLTAPQNNNPSTISNTLNEVLNSELVLKLTLAIQRKDYVEAYELLEKPADQGNPIAQEMLGTMYHDGSGVKQSDEQAVLWFTRSAVQGNADAQYNLGEAYREGVGVKKDINLALSWLLKAAEQGQIDAEHNLGALLLNGDDGVPKDYQKAYKWFNAAAAQGDEEAKNLSLKMVLDGLVVQTLPALVPPSSARSDHDAAPTPKSVPVLPPGFSSKDLLKPSPGLLINRDEGAVAEYGDECSRGSVKACTETIDSWLSSDHQKATAYNNRGYIYEHADQCSAALPDFAKAIKLDPDFAAAYDNQAVCYNKNKQYQDAIYSMTTAIAVWPNDTRKYAPGEGGTDPAATGLTRAATPHLFYYGRGIIYENMGRSEDALADYREAMRLDPTNTKAADGVKRLAPTSPPNAADLLPPNGGSALLPPPSSSAPFLVNPYGH
jgi:TPR repeat protein